jgi:AcrR family transcriptional regulator
MQQRSQATRARILEAAAQRFGCSGYNATSVDQICAEAGVSKGAFYHHFPSKQALFLALLEAWLGTINKGIDLLHQEGESIPETLINMTAMLPAVFAAADQRLPMFLEFWLQASRDEAVWKATIAPYRHYRERFAKLVEVGIAEGSLQPVDPQVAAQVILSLAVGLVLQGVLDPKGADWQKVAEQSLQVLMNGLVNHSPLPSSPSKESKGTEQRRN